MIDEQLQRLVRAEEEWKNELKVGSKGAVFSEDLDIEIKPVYTPADLGGWDYLNSLGFPGQYPFTRGPYPEMSRHGPWRYSIFSGFGSAEDTNARWKMLYEAGQRSLNLAPDLPTHLGLDSDHPMAYEEVGRVGMAVDTIRDFEILFEGLPLDELPFSTNVEALAPLIIAMYIAVAEKKGIPAGKLSGTISNDPLSTAAGKQTVVFPLASCVRLSADLIEFCTKNLPRFYPINLKGVNMREGGCSMVQEMGFVFSFACTYLDECLIRGLDIDEVAPKFSFFCCQGLHIFEEAAKYRASRRLWGSLMKEKYGAQKRESMLFRFTSICNPREFHAELPEINLVRGACGILAAALGGAQGMLHPAFDETYAIPSERSCLLALASQQVIAEETNINKTVDPLGGSYYVEYLTNLLEEKIAAKMQEVVNYGGPVKAIEDGYIQKQILENFLKEEEAVNSGKKVVVGKNKYKVAQEEPDLELHIHDQESAQRQIQRTLQIKAERDNGAVQASLARLKSAAETGENVMPYLIECSKNYVSLGEMTGALQEVFGRYREPRVI